MKNDALVRFLAPSFAFVLFLLDSLSANATGSLRPVVDCVASDGNGRFTAVFGYVNGGGRVNVPVGLDNRIDDGLNPIDRRQPTVFKKGRSTPTTGGTRVPFSGTVAWTLKGQTATATPGSPTCTKNLAPVVLDKFLRMEQGATGEINVDLSVDALDPEGQSMSVKSAGKPSHGATSAHGRVLRYQPNASFFGTDEFTYTVVDSKGLSSSATVLVAVEPLALVTTTQAKCSDASCVCIEGARRPYDCEDIESKCRKFGEVKCNVYGGSTLCYCVAKASLLFDLLF